MVKIVFSGASAPSAFKLMEADDDVEISRSHSGEINWGRAHADTKLNPDITNTTNKRLMRELFRQHDVPMPPLVDEDLAFGPWSHNRPVVGRPDRHTRGRGFWLCRNPRDIQRALRGTRTKRAATHFMEYVDAPHEVRVHIFQGKSIRISEKDFHDTDGCHKLYTTIKPTVDIRQVRKAAKQAVEALGLDFGCVDILVEDDGTPYVLEVNTAPGLGGTLPQLYAKVFKEWADACN